MKVLEPKSSFKVFSSFIYQKQDGSYDVTKVFSKECLSVWLKTRTKNIKHPQQSFQRVLYAHIRGADTRKPFTQPVETALLVELRKKGIKSPWHGVLPTKQAMTKRPFSNKGFHEKQQILQDNTDLRVKAQEKHIYIKEKEYNQPTNAKASPIENFLKAFETHIPAQQRHNILSEAKRRGVTLDSQAISNLTNENKIKFDPKFVLFKPEEQYWFPGLEVGEVKITDSWVLESYSHSSASATELKCSNKHLFELAPCLKNAFLLVSLILPVYGKDGVVWLRTLVEKPSEGFDIFHVQLIKEQNSTRALFQVVSPLYAAGNSFRSEYLV